jgi:hypothetical protein
VRIAAVVLAGLLFGSAAHAQSTATQDTLGYINGNGTYVPYDSIGAGIPTLPSVTTYQGAITVTTSAAISTMTLSKGTFPTGAVGNVSISNVGANTGYVCWLGGTCSAAVGQAILAGITAAKNVGASTVSPTVFSTSGTTLVITN